MALHFYSLCGNLSEQGLFWDWQRTWNNSSPSIPVCFQDSVLTWIPGFLLIFICVLYFPYLWWRRLVQLTWHQKTPRQNAKLALSAAIVLVHIISIIFVVCKDKGETALVSYLSPAILCFVSLIVGFCQHLEFSRAIHSSGALLFYWTLVLVLGGWNFATKLDYLKEDTQTEADLFLCVAFFITYGLSCIQFLLCLVTDRKKDGLRKYNRQRHLQGEDELLIENDHMEEENSVEVKKRPDPESVATCLSLVYHYWFYGIYHLGMKRPVTFEDIYELPAMYKCAAVISYIKPITEAKNRIKLLTLLLRASRRPILVTTISRIVILLSDVVNPLLLNIFLITLGDAHSRDWQCYFLSACFFLVNIIKGAAFSVYAKNFFFIRLRVKSTISASVYRKTLLVTAEARARTTVGELVNLLSVDTNRLELVYYNIAELWATPIMVVISLVIQYSIIGKSCFASLIVFVICAPINGFYIIPKQATAQRYQMKEKDQRIKILSEIFNGIKALKMYVWEPPFIERIKNIRRKEMKYIRENAILACMGKILWFSSPYLMMLAVFTTFTLISEEKLTPQMAFTIFALIDSYNTYLSLFTIFLSDVGQAVVSLKRIEKFLNEEEVGKRSIEPKRTCDNEVAVSFHDASYSWDSDSQKTTLRNINLDVTTGSLVGVVGKVGTGKSSLLSAVIGEMNNTKGYSSVNASLAYVPQQAWILNATVRDNILFGQPLDEDRYWTAIKACALVPDLKILPAGDFTEIGVKGVNLSGGQKQRVSLARAVYQNRDIYLLDDPLSAVDAHVGKHIFNHVLGPQGLLASKTRILVTHSLQYLKDMDRVFLMEDGEIVCQGAYDELLRQSSIFAEYVQKDVDETEEEMDKTETTAIKRQLSRLESVGEKKNDGKLMSSEKAGKGRISLSVFLAYMKACGVWYVFMTFLSLFLYTGSLIGLGMWLQHWSDDNQTQKHTATFWLVGFASLTLVRIVSTGGTSLMAALGSLEASMTMHSKLLMSVLRCPMLFFDTTPTGRLLNRFASDVDEVDSQIANFGCNSLFQLSQVGSSFFVVVYSLPIILAFFCPLLIVYVVLYWINMTTGRQLKRIMSITKSPVFSYLEESLQGVSSIRAYGHQERFVTNNDSLVDDMVMATYNNFLTDRCMAVILGTLGSVFILLAAVFSCLIRHDFSAGQVGLVISFSINLTWQVHFMMKALGETEKRLVAVERIFEYSHLDSEAEWKNENSPVIEWPREAQIKFISLSARYDEDLPLVLNEVSAIIRPGEKVGIVGRTGAGKSSLVSCLFRLMEPVAGQIQIDGLDISTIGLHDLRSKISVIPQDPVMFSGTIRQNLDPFESYSDEEVWKALERAHLMETVKTSFGGLEYDIGEGGVNLSMGQRQLICLARCLLKPFRILILDEATAAVDIHTDDLIQMTIRQEFTETTIMTIAHRINTVMDYDKIMVLQNGRIEEFDSPDNLINKDSLFASMVQEAQ